MTATFRTGLARDFLNSDRQPAFEVVELDLLDSEPTVIYEVSREFRDEIGADQIADYNALTSLVCPGTVRSFDTVRRSWPSTQTCWEHGIRCGACLILETCQVRNTSCGR